MYTINVHTEGHSQTLVIKTKDTQQIAPQYENVMKQVQYDETTGVYQQQQQLWTTKPKCFLVRGWVLPTIIHQDVDSIASVCWFKLLNCTQSYWSIYTHKLCIHHIEADLTIKQGVGCMQHLVQHKAVLWVYNNTEKHIYLHKGSSVYFL